MSKLQLVDDVNCLLVTEDKTVQPHMEEMKVLVGLENSDDESWPALVSMPGSISVLYSEVDCSDYFIGVMVTGQALGTHEISYNSDLIPSNNKWANMQGLSISV